MTLQIADRVWETTTTTGTGTYALAGAKAGYQAFSAACANSDTALYCATDGVDWEVGFGTWATGNNLARTTIIASSNSNAAVSWGAGSKDIFLDIPALLMQILNNPVAPKTTNYSITALDNGKHFTNTGAVGTVVYSLPTWALGLKFGIIATAAQIVQLTADSGSTIRNAADVTASSGNVQSDGSVGPLIIVEAVAAGQWFMTQISGQWTVN